jgi:dTMP kinase
VARGRFITLEGGEGAGKSTQARLLAGAIETLGMRTLLTREPGGSEGAEAIRGLLVEGDSERWDATTETLLHFAARRDHLERAIRPALAAGACVVCDRFADSTVAYQGYGHGVDRSLIAALHKAVVGETDPDLTVILDIEVEEGLRRAADRSGGVPDQVRDRYERMDVAFHRRVRQGFLEILRMHPRRCVLVDAGPGVESVQAAIRAAVRERVGLAL